MYGGKSIIAVEEIKAGDIIAVYDGRPLTPDEMDEIKKAGAKDNEFIFEIQIPGSNKSWGIDASREEDFRFLGRWCNHSRDKGTKNCRAKTIWVKDRYFTYFVASRDINPGEHILYEYGDKTLKAFLEDPWLGYPFKIQTNQPRGDASSQPSQVTLNCQE